MNRDDTWMIGAQAVKDGKVQSNQPYIPTLTGKPSADQLQIDQLYESIAQPFDDAVKLFPEILEDKPGPADLRITDRPAVGRHHQGSGAIGTA